MSAALAPLAAAPGWLVARPIAHRGRHDRAGGVIENSLAAYDRMSSTCVGLTWVRPRATFTSTMKYTTRVTMMRRGTSLVMANMLLSTATNTKIGMAFNAMASGVTISPSTL